MCFSELRFILLSVCVVCVDSHQVCTVALRGWKKDDDHRGGASVIVSQRAWVRPKFGSSGEAGCALNTELQF